MSIESRLRLSACLTFRILNAAQYIIVSEFGEKVRISKTGAVLVGFYILHALPNLLLLSERGRKRYSEYGSFHSSCVSTRFVEVFLLGALLVHVKLAVRKQSKPTFMLFSGSLIGALLLSHLLDFRLHQSLDKLDEKVRRTIKRRKISYSVFVLAVAAHTWRGATPAWLFRLGFTEKSELLFLHRLCRALILSSVALYHIPILR